MKRLAGVLVLAAALGGCRSAGKHGCASCGDSHARGKQAAPGMQMAQGQPNYACAAGGCGAPSGSMNGATIKPGQMLNAKVMSPEIIQASHVGGACMNGACGMPNGGSGPGGPCGYGNMMTLSPGSPIGPGACGIGGPAGAVAAVGALTGGMAYGMPGGAASSRTSIRFAAPADMKISWYGAGMVAQAGYDANQLTVPARYNFNQGAVYRLRLSNIPNQGNLVLYPTLEVVPANVKTAVFLAHSSVPVAFTDEDFAQVRAGNYLVKVIYLPDPMYQDLATAGPSEIVSTRLEPGADPIAEACRRGSILAVVRVGNIDLEAPNTPAMDGANPLLGNRMPAGNMTAPGRMMVPAGVKPVAANQ